MKKNEIVRQHDLKDCGVSSLLSIIIHYGGYVPIETLRIDCNTTLEGTTAYDIIKTAQKYGFDSYGIKLDSIDDENIKLPCIAHLVLKNGLFHYVVIYNIKKNHIELMDPSKGKVIMKKEEFTLYWTKNILLFHPIQFIPIISKPYNIINVLKKIILLNKSTLSVLFLVSAILIILSIITNLYFQIGIKSFNNGIEIFKITATFFFILIIIKGILHYYRNKIEISINKAIDSKLFTNFIYHLFSLPLKIFHNRSTGEIVSRINDLNNIRNLFTEILVIVFLDSIMALFTMLILLHINKEMFFCLCFLILLYCLVGIVYSKTIYKKVLKNIELESDFNSSVVHNIEMIDSIKNLSFTNTVIKKINNKLFSFINNNYTFNNYINIYENIKNNIYEIGLFFINSYGFYLIYLNKISILELITFNNLLIFMFEPIKNVINIIPKYYYIKASIYKISEFISIEKEKLIYNEEFINGDLVINNLSYNYNPYKKVIDNLSLVIKKNSHVMIKGKSGTGKSTLCKLITRNIDIQKGEICFSEVSINDYNVATIRNNILYVNQLENLYPDTIKNNIIFNRDCSTKKFHDICHLCGVDKIVNNKAFRYDSLILENSANLSGGEKQRIILARALLQDFKILILDEALSEVDYELETEIINNLRKYYKDKTIIYVSHKNHEKLFDECIEL